MTTGSAATGRRARVAVGGQHADRAGVGQRAAGRELLGAEELRAGEQHGGALGGGQRREVVGMQARQVVDRARAGGQRHRHRAVGVELLHVGAQRHALAPRDLAQPLEVVVAEGDRLDVDVERVDVGLGGELVDHVHPARGVVALRDRVREQARHPVADPARQPRQAQLGLARQAVAGLGLDRRRPPLAHLLAHRQRLRQHLRRRSPPPARGPRRRSRRRRARSPRTARR